jgi:hypothetical protein
LAVQALSGTFTTKALAEQAGVSRKFVYHQIDQAQQALAEAFAARLPICGAKRLAPMDPPRETRPVVEPRG